MSNHIAGLVHRLVEDERARFEEPPSAIPHGDSEWHKLQETGTRLWLDTGDIDQAAELWTSEFEALTTNNTLLNREVQKGGYDAAIRRIAGVLNREAPALSGEERIRETGFVLNAVHALRLVDRFDAHVSVELHTAFARRVELTVEYGRRYYALCPERFYVKVPLTPEGFLAARRLGREGIPVNFTLGFSARQNYLAACLAQPLFANVFMGRLNAFVVDSGLGSGAGIGEKATLASQRELIQLRENGASRTKQIGASMRDPGQVAALAGVDIFTLPVKVARAYREQPANGIGYRVGEDPAVDLDEDASFVHELWDVPRGFKQAVAALLDLDPDSLQPPDLPRHFAEAGFPGFLPEWSPGDEETVRRDGKIPVLEHWRDRLRDGSVGLDALMNLSGLHSFATDQQALDGRIRRFIDAAERS
ncbi:transaldolase family protein [Kiritimatiella glycovorans]|uniref:Putative transaldolase n=1 Tax=Kiritimatiella glycovorans TaxID=1307763 RepID=A0A0G3EF89_9BACT|nr:transaldolase family protein [Kiritimatiella glycovorans]AKJ64092.1 putative transaldolase [Kiritimatiella glycovorans]